MEHHMRNERKRDGWMDLSGEAAKPDIREHGAVKLYTGRKQ